MEIELMRPDESTWQYDAVEDGKKVGYVIFFPRDNKRTLFIGYIQSKRPGTGTALVQSVIEYGGKNGFDTITGTLIPTPGFELAAISLFTKFGFDIDKRGRISKKL